MTNVKKEAQKETFWAKVKSKAANFWPRTKALILKWYDALILVPAALILFIFNESWIRLIDQTAASMSLEFLGILNFNILIGAIIFVASYVIYNLYFHDFFDKGWEKKLAEPGGVAAAIIHLILWLSTLIATAFFVLKSLTFIS